MLFLNKVKVNNSLYANILTQCGNVNAVNCLFGNSNNYSAYVSIGGNVQFDLSFLISMPFKILMVLFVDFCFPKSGENKRQSNVIRIE